MAVTKITLLLFALLALGACKKEEPAELPDQGYDYFPTAVGTWVEYQVDSMWRDDPSDVRDSVSYRLLERIVDEYTDLEGRPCQRIHRFVKDANDLWVVRDVWTAIRSNSAAEKTEENERRLKLSFPVREGRTWDANVYNTVSDLSVAYRDEGEPWGINGLDFATTVLVKNTQPPNFVIKRNFEERYAKNVGLVSKYWEETNTQVTYPTPTPVDPNPAPVINVVGWRLDMQAVAFGSE